jgi:hypothetical protein
MTLDASRERSRARRTSTEPSASPSELRSLLLLLWPRDPLGRRASFLQFLEVAT